jgi:hypothetical protein
MSRPAPGTLLWIALAPGKVALAKVLYAQHDILMLALADQLFAGDALPDPLPPFAAKIFLHAADAATDGPITKAGRDPAPIDPKSTTRVRGGAVYIAADKVRAWLPGKDKLPMEQPLHAHGLVAALSKRFGLAPAAKAAAAKKRP